MADLKNSQTNAEMVIGNISSFESMGLVDGPGVRYVIFLQGCPLRCAYCHNPETWNINEKKTQMTAQELLNKVKRYMVYFKNGGGVTVSGGEPLLQAKFVTEFFKLCKQNNIHTCLDTSGCGDERDYADLLDYTDLILLDVKAIVPENYQKLTGRAIDKFEKFLDICQEKDKKLWIRQVIIPDYNDTEESVLRLKEFVKNLHNVEKVELLPYHTMATEKYKKLGIKYRLEGVPQMDKKRCKDLEKLLK